MHIIIIIIYFAQCALYFLSIGLSIIPVYLSFLPSLFLAACTVALISVNDPVQQPLIPFVMLLWSETWQNWHYSYEVFVFTPQIASIQNDPIHSYFVSYATLNSRKTLILITQTLSLCLHHHVINHYLIYTVVRNVLGTVWSVQCF